MHDPRDNHLLLVKCVLCYIRDTTDYGLTLFRCSSNKLTLTGQVAQTLDGLPQDTVTSSVLIWCHGLLSGSTQSLAPVPRPSTGRLRMWWQKLVGYGSFFRNFIDR